MQKVVVLGSTGSVGKSSLEVIEKNKEKYEIVCLVAFSNEDLINKQAKRQTKRFKPDSGNCLRFQQELNIVETLFLRQLALFSYQ